MAKIRVVEELRGLVDLIRSDLLHAARQAAAFQAERPGLLRQISIFLTPPAMCTTLHRVAHAFHRTGWTGLARAVARINLLLHRALIEPSAAIGHGLYIPHTSGIVFRGTAGRNLCLYAQAIVGPQHAPPFAAVPELWPHLGDDVVVGAFAIVFGAVSIGDRVQIGPGAVARASQPADTILIAPHLHPRRQRLDDARKGRAEAVSGQAPS